MPLKPSVVLANIQGTSQLLSYGNSSPAVRQQRARRSVARFQHRPYAQHAGDSSQQETNDKQHIWPQCGTRSIPTPYEILDCTKETPYSKRAFYELVKIYHPDRDGYATGHTAKLSRAVRTERYLLIVEAHELLSDPVKKRAYDRWGAGWDGQPNVTVQRRTWGAQSKSDGHNFYSDNASAAQNATWEDWERWYHQRSGKFKQEPRYTSNESFVGIMLVFIAVGASLELGRASKMSKSFKDQVTARHIMVSDGLAKRRDDLEALDGRDARVKNFLKVRDTGYQGAEVLPPPQPPPALREDERKSLPPPRSFTSGWK